MRIPRASTAALSAAALFAGAPLLTACAEEGVEIQQEQDGGGEEGGEGGGEEDEEDGGEGGDGGGY